MLVQVVPLQFSTSGNTRDAEDSVARLDALVVVGEGFVLPQSFGENSIFLDLRVD